MSKRIFIPITNTDDWKSFLAKPDKHWRTGFSSRTLAKCWESADDFPPEVKTVFEQSENPEFNNLEMLLAFPEYKVYLPPRGHPSQNDMFVLAKDSCGNLVSITVEGKVNEPFGPTLAKWNQSKSRGKTKRFEFLKELLGVIEIPHDIRYQLLHRSASAILEALRFNARSAVMLIHSFSSESLWLDDFQTFASLFDVKAEPDKLYFLKNINGIPFYIAWIKGNQKFLME
jgi:hypothetical protein